MKLLYVTGEAAPFAASGGLGDVMGALPPAIKRKSPEDDIRVILPLYKDKMAPKYVSALKKTAEFWFRYAWRDAYCGIYELEHEGVIYYFVDNEQYFKRPSLYGYFDDGERFAYFSLAVIEFLLHADYIPDVLHANDWQCALSVIYLKTKFSGVDKLKRIKTVYTIHNIEYQGKYDLALLYDIFCLEHRYTSVVEYDGCINLMKGALVAADRITTVSPNYAYELRQAFFAFGLQHIINLYGYKLSGIINGIDTVYFSPCLGGEIPHPYSVETAHAGKAANKRALQEELSLPVNETVPMAVMITRLTEGKGLDLLLHIFDELLSEDMQLVILGTGDDRYERTLSEIARRYPDKARVLLRFDRALSKRMYAAADLFLMPSKSEPCGLAQMIACSYGTLPVVRAVGGLHDTIIPAGNPGANGFVFRNFNAHELLFRIKDALALYQNKEEWQALVRSAMETNFTWDVSAEKYLGLYRSL
jgi:starch synthase